MNIEAEVNTIMSDAGWATSVSRQGEALPFARKEGAFWVINGKPNGVDDHGGVAGPNAEFQDPIALARALVDRAKVVDRAPIPWASPDVRAALDPFVPHETEVFEEPAPDPRDAEIARLRRELEEARAAAEAPLLPAPDALMADWGPVGGEDITGDMLLDAFEADEAETAAVVQTLSALRLKHLSEQLNVERARLDREHQATGVANPRSASIDRLLGLLTRRGEV